MGTGPFSAGDGGNSIASGAPAHKPDSASTVSKSIRKHADKQALGSGSAQARIVVGMGASVEAADGGENAALRALVQKLPDLSYMLSDSLVLSPRTR